MAARIPALLVAHLDLMAHKLNQLARETQIAMLATASHDQHAEMDRDEAFHCARTYAVSIGKVTEAIEMAKYRIAEIASVRDAVGPPEGV